MSPEPTDARTSDSKGDPDHSSRRSIRRAEREAEREAILTGQQPLLTRREMKRLREEAEALRAAVAAGEITIEQARALQDPLADDHNVVIPSVTAASSAPAASEAASAEAASSSTAASSAEAASSATASSAEAAAGSHDYSASEGALGVGHGSGPEGPDEPVATPGGVVAEPAQTEEKEASSAPVDSLRHDSAPPAGRAGDSADHSAPADGHRGPTSHAAASRAQEPAAGHDDGRSAGVELPWVRAWYASHQAAPPSTSSAAASEPVEPSPMPQDDAEEASPSSESHEPGRSQDGQAQREQQIGSASSLSADQVVEISGFETGVLPAAELPLAQDGPRSTDGASQAVPTAGLGPGSNGEQNPPASPPRRSLMERGAQADSPGAAQQPASPQRGWQPPQADRGYEPTWRRDARDGSALSAPQAEASPVSDEVNNPASQSGSTTAEPSAPSAIRRPIVRIPAAAQGVRTMNASTGELGSVQPVDEDFDGIDSPQWRALRSGDEAPLEAEAPSPGSPADTVVTTVPADLRDDQADDPGHVVPSPYGSYAGYNEPAEPSEPAVAEPQAGHASFGARSSTESWEDVTRPGKDSSGSPASRRTLAVLLAFVLAAVVLIIIWVVISQVGGSSVNAEAVPGWSPLLT
ncbi:MULTISPECIES: hypothetical protein [Actinomyces]|uniref:hypothetical protein n=1 Tax=Actinomyces TaxID=1654 RepID=UPI001357323C|nr:MULTISPECIES: hypothetical protein [Actinomyces]